MKERVCVFGSEGGLVGVLSEPAQGTAADMPAVLLTNVGIQHRVGPYRVWVGLARTLAARGYPVLRFDSSGLGDSAARSDTRDELSRAVADLRDAMDYLERRRGIRRFVVVGFCSGTDGAYRVALEDPRVAGMAWVEGYAYRTRRFYLTHWYSTRFLNRHRWRVALRRLAGRVRGPSARGPVLKEQDVIYTRDYPAPSELARGLRTLVDRGVKLFAAYGGAEAITYAYEGQLFDMLPGDFRGQIEEAYFEDADHLFTGRAVRERLLARLVAWVERSFPSAALPRTGT